MHPPASPTARRAFTALSALSLSLVAPWTTLAAEETPPTGEETPPAETEPAPATASAGPIDGPGEDEPATPLTIGPWHLAAIDDAPEGFFVRGVASGELGTIAVGNLEFGGPPQPAAWLSLDGMSWERARFRKGARSGLVEAVVATPDGWVAVGRSVPEGADAWTSPDGRAWSAATSIQSARNHVMYDVAATPIGLVAVGCKVADFHCKSGKAWLSQDGRRWSVLSDLPIALPRAIVMIDSRIVVAGFSNGVGTESSHAITASSRDGLDWKLGTPRGPIASGFNDIDAFAEQGYAFGYQLGQRAPDDKALLGQSADGRSWTPVEAAALEGWDGIGLAASDELMLLVGTGNIDDFIAPITYASSDLASWVPGTFSEGLRAETYHVFGTAFTFAGDKAILVGAVDYAPGIWWADVAPVGSPAVEPAAMGPLGPVTPTRFVRGTMPEAPVGTSVRDVISGGPGYIAVGGGVPDGDPATALAWSSRDGVTWEAAAIAEDDREGVMAAVAALPDGGYVTLGSGGTTTAARAWYSPDGTSWAAAPLPESFTGWVVTDVTSTPDGVVAVGCEVVAGSADDCGPGRIWATADGMTWELTQELDVTPFAAAALGSTVAAGGTEAAESDGGQAVIAIDDGAGWARSAPLAAPESRVVAMASSADGLVATGWQRLPGKQTEAAAFLSSDGLTWDTLTDKRLRGMTPTSVGIGDEGLLLTGTKVDKRGQPVPLAYWTRDLEDLEPVRFPKDLDPETTVIEGGGMAADGSMAFAVGADDLGPAIWYSNIE